MLRNYLLLALKVLRRRPFYTFIALFGISFTLMILMLIASLGDASLGKNAPMTEADRMVIVSGLERYTLQYDTLRTIDTIPMDDGTVRYDSTETLEPNGSRNVSNGSIAYPFLTTYLDELEGVTTRTFFSSGNQLDAYLNGQKLAFNVTYTDAEYWRVFDFDVLAGDLFRTEDVAAGNQVAVLTKPAAEDYFGESGAAVIGRDFELGRKRYTVRGVVDRPLRNDDLVGSNVFLPLTSLDARALGKPGDLQGSFVAVFLANTPSDRQRISDQLEELTDNFEMPPEETSYEQIKLYSGTATEAFAMNTIGSNDPDEALFYLFVPLGILLALFIILPLINLINLSVSRISERAGEIAVRKAFGADSGNILVQFLLENLILTFIGGVIGLVLAYLTIRYVNAEQLLGGTRLSFSPAVFGYALLIILLFGLLSGVWPAYRMSRTGIADSLR